MKLTEYVLKQGGTCTPSCPVLALLASDAGCGRATLYMIAKGHKVPSARLAGRIADATANTVTRSDLLPEVFPGAGANGAGEVPADPDERRIVPVEGA